MSLCASPAENGSRGWLVSDDLGFGRSEGWRHFVFFSERGIVLSYPQELERKKKEAKKKEGKGRGRVWALPKGPCLSPSLEKNKQVLTQILSRQWGPPQ